MVPPVQILTAMAEELEVATAAAAQEEISERRRLAHLDRAPVVVHARIMAVTIMAEVAAEVPAEVAVLERVVLAVVVATQEELVAVTAQEAAEAAVPTLFPQLIPQQEP